MKTKNEMELSGLGLKIDAYITLPLIYFRSHSIFMPIFRTTSANGN
jgi:hypothetical protein